MKYPRAKEREKHQKLFRSFSSSRNSNNATFFLSKALLKLKSAPDQSRLVAHDIVFTRIKWLASRRGFEPLLPP